MCWSLDPCQCLRTVSKYTHKVRMKENSMSERLEFFDHASQTAQKWTKDLAEDLQWVDGPKVFRLLRATLHAVRDWLQVNEAAQFGAQLPTLIRVKVGIPMPRRSSRGPTMHFLLASALKCLLKLCGLWMTPFRPSLRFCPSM